MSGREQFTITAKDQAYEGILAAVPAEFVGTKGQLMPLVQLLCSEMAAAFSACSVTCPPWRAYRSMLSKWIPAKVLPLLQAACIAGTCLPANASEPGCNPASPAGLQRTFSSCSTYQAPTSSCAQSASWATVHGTGQSPAQVKHACNSLRPQCMAQVKDQALFSHLDGDSPTSTLTPPGSSPPYPFGTPSFPAYRLQPKGSPGGRPVRDSALACTTCTH